MLDIIVPNIICFQTQKQLASLNNIRVLLKSVLTDLRARNFVRVKTSLRARRVHARHRTRILSSPEWVSKAKLRLPQYDLGTFLHSNNIIF